MPKPDPITKTAESLTHSKQRKKLMEELNSFQKGRDIPGFQEYTDKMNRLDKTMKKYCVPNSYGAVAQLDPRARESLLRSMKETAEAGEEYKACSPSRASQRTRKKR